MGLKLDKPVCDVSEVQELQIGGAFEVDESNSRALEVFRGCRVQISGTLGIPLTGSYSTEIYQTANKVEPHLECVRQKMLPDYSNAKPNPEIRRYRVTMLMRFDEREGQLSVDVRSGRAILAPWQAYANYLLTRGSVFCAYCADGFKLSHVTGTPEAQPDGTSMDNAATMFPDSDATEKLRNLRLSYSCRR